MRRRSFLTLASASAAAVLSGCSTGPSGGEGGSDPTSSGGAAGASTDQDAFPVTIKHALGTTTITKAPTRIATIGWSDADTLVALGVAPVGAPRISWGGNKAGSTDWFDKALAKLGGKQPERYDDSDGAPHDEIAQLRPDLILATNSGITPAEYARLTKLAPVVAYPRLPWGTSWQETADLVGRAIGLGDEARRQVGDVERRLRTAVAKYPQLKGKSAAWLSFTPTDTSKFAAYTTVDNRPRVLEEMGLTLSPTVASSSKGTKSFSVDISAEKAANLQADVVVFYVDKPGQDKQVLGHPLLGRIPALKQKAYYAADNPVTAMPLSSPTLLSVPEALKTFLPKLAAAASKA